MNCAMSMSAAYGAPLDDIPCPVCRIVPDQAQNMVDRIDRIPDTAIEIEDDESGSDSEVSVSVRAAIRELPASWASGTLRETASTCEDEDDADSDVPTGVPESVDDAPDAQDRSIDDDAPDAPPPL